MLGWMDGARVGIVDSGLRIGGSGLGRGKRLGVLECR